jgi:hypothetical protein
VTALARCANPTITPYEPEPAPPATSGMGGIFLALLLLGFAGVFFAGLLLSLKPS